MSNKSPKTITAEPISPARQDLAKQIARLAQRRDEIETLDAAIQRNEQARIDMNERLEEAKIQLDSAIKNRPAMLVRAAKGEILDAWSDINRAKAHIEELESEKVNLYETRDALLAAKSEIVMARGTEEARLESAVRETMLTDPAIPAMLARFKVLRQEYFELLPVAEFVTVKRLLPEGCSIKDVWPTPEDSKYLMNFLDAMRRMSLDASTSLPAP